ncbi:MAG: hypothetical protein PHG64_10980 [Paludibacter sp.]|nr:hypothetical protein [Paludibacter sp.]
MRSKYFKEALIFCLDNHGYGSQSWLARKTGLGQQYISKLASRSNTNVGSENSREKIVKACGYEYEDFISLGKKLIAGEIPEQIPPETPPKPETQPEPEADLLPPSESELKLLNVVFKLAHELKQIREELSEIRKNTDSRQKLKPDPDEDQKLANSKK